MEIKINTLIYDTRTNINLFREKNLQTLIYVYSSHTRNDRTKWVMEFLILKLEYANSCLLRIKINLTCKVF